MKGRPDIKDSKLLTLVQQLKDKEFMATIGMKTTSERVVSFVVDAVAHQVAECLKPCTGFVLALLQQAAPTTVFSEEVMPATMTKKNTDLSGTQEEEDPFLVASTIMVDSFFDHFFPLAAQAFTFEFFDKDKKKVAVPAEVVVVTPVLLKLVRTTVILQKASDKSTKNPLRINDR